MPTLDFTIELLARVEYPIIVVLVVDGTGQTVPEHAFRQRGKGFDRVLLEKGGRGRRIALRIGVCSWCAELIELIFRWKIRCQWISRNKAETHTPRHGTIPRGLRLPQGGL